MYGNRFLPMFLFGMFVMIAAGVPVAFAAFRLLRLVNRRKLPAVAKWICRIALGGVLAAAVAPSLGAGTLLTPSADLRGALRADAAGDRDLSVEGHGVFRPFDHLVERALRLLHRGAGRVGLLPERPLA